MFKFSPLLIWYAFAIMNPFSWIMIASEKRCPTSVAVWSRPRPQVVVSQGSKWVLFAPRASLSFDQRHVTRCPPIRKRIWVGRHNNVIYLFRRALQRSIHTVQGRVDSLSVRLFILVKKLAVSGRHLWYLVVKKSFYISPNQLYFRQDARPTIDCVAWGS